MNLDEWLSAGKPLNSVVCCDCLEGMKHIEDNSIDLVLTDPPYGKQWTRPGHAVGMAKSSNETDSILWDKSKPSKQIFDEIRRVSKNQIIFGGNYFSNYLPASNCWIVWDKIDDLKLGKQINFAQCELLWTSFTKTVKKYVLRQQGFINDSFDERVHPTQKPTELIQSILDDFSNENDTIFDPFAGSGTTGVACVNLKRNYLLFEISPEYCAIAEKRIAEAKAQTKLQ